IPTSPPSRAAPVWAWPSCARSSSITAATWPSRRRLHLLAARASWWRSRRVEPRRDSRSRSRDLLRGRGGRSGGGRRGGGLGGGLALVALGGGLVAGLVRLLGLLGVLGGGCLVGGRRRQG